MARIEEVIDASVVTGEFDIVLKVICDDAQHLGKVIRKIGSIPDVIKTCTSVLMRSLKIARRKII